MRIKFKGLTGALAIFATVCVGSTANAQTAPNNQAYQYRTPAEQFEQVFFTHNKDFFQNRSFGRQLDFEFGFGSLKTGFVENETSTDTKAIDLLYKEALLKQGSSDPLVRTRDLPNPYSSSISQSSLIEAIRSAQPTE
jgi:hypothetical protein